MIKVTRLDDSELVINTDSIKLVEAIPDTMISLTNGKKVMAKENVDEILKGIEQHRKRFTQMQLKIGR